MNDLLKSKESLAQLIDSTFLDPTGKIRDIEKLCFEAKKYGFKSVCVHSSMAKLAYQNIKGSNVDLTVVVGFPLGMMDTESKIFEAVKAVENGADEIDTVINIGLVKSGEWSKVENEIHNFVRVLHNMKTLKGKTPIVKIIIETGVLSHGEKIGCSQVIARSRADFGKTCTGFQGGEATVEDVKLMLSYKVKEVKASGGVRTLSKLEELVEAGATRIGTSSAVNIMEEFISGNRAVDSGEGY